MLEKPNLDLPALALAVKAQDLPDHYLWAIANSFALEYMPDPARLEMLANHLDPAIKAGVPIL